METPVTRRSRTRLKKGAPKISSIDGVPSEISPPSSEVKDNNVNITSYVEALERKASFTSRYGSDIAEDDDDMFPSTQAFQDVRKQGEVYWDYEASPSTRDALRKRIYQDSPELPTPRSPPKAITPTLKLRTRRPTRPEFDSEALSLLENLRALNEEAEQAKVAEDKIPDESEQIFDTDEDSFLLLCSQAVEENHPKSATKKQEPHVDSNQNSKGLTPAKTNHFIDDFDDDFDDILSQVEMPAQPVILSKKNLDFPNKAGPSKSIISEPTSSRSSSNQQAPSSFSFKRFKSADNIPKPRIRNTSGNIMKTWQRSHSSPEALGKKKCSKEEIEKKKQAALKRRQEKSSQM